MEPHFLRLNLKTFKTFDKTSCYSIKVCLRTALFKFNYFNIVRRLLTCGVACCGCFISGYKDLPVAPVATLSSRWIVPHAAFMTVSYYIVLYCHSLFNLMSDSVPYRFVLKVVFDLKSPSCRFS